MTILTKSLISAGSGDWDSGAGAAGDTWTNGVDAGASAAGDTWNDGTDAGAIAGGDVGTNGAGGGDFTCRRWVRRARCTVHLINTDDIQLW